MVHMPHQYLEDNVEVEPGMLLRFTINFDTCSTLFLCILQGDHSKFQVWTMASIWLLQLAFCQVLQLQYRGMLNMHNLIVLKLHQLLSLAQKAIQTQILHFFVGNMYQTLCFRQHQYICI